MDWNKEIDQTPATKASDYWYKEVTPELRAKKGPKPNLTPIIDDPNKMASTVGLMGASLPTDPMAKASFYASRRFPGDKKALNRYGVSDGRIFYTDKSGQRYFEEPKAALPTSVDDARRLAGSVVGSAGDALSMGGGILGGLAAPGVGGGIPSAMMGGMAADTLRQLLANQITGEEKSLGSRALQTGAAGLTEGAGQGIGLLGAKGLSRLGKTPTFDMSGSEELGQAARRMDVPLTVAEETGHPSLIRRQKILGSTTAGEEVFNEFYQMRNEKVRDALADYLNEVSMIKSVSQGVKGGVEGARASIKAERKGLQAKAGPHYRRAFEENPPVDVSGIVGHIDNLMKNAKGQRATVFGKIKKLFLRPESAVTVQDIPEVSFPDRAHADLYQLSQKFDKKSAQRLYQHFVGYVEDLNSVSDMERLAAEYAEGITDQVGGIRRYGRASGETAPFVTDPDDKANYLIRSKNLPPQNVVDDRIEALHDVKLNIDEMLENPKDNSIGRVTARDIREIKDQLVDALADASPDYEVGRSIYEEGFPALTELQKSAVGDIAKLEGRATLRASRTIFNSRVSSPEDVIMARDAFLKAGQEDQWNGLVRAHLEDALESIPENAYGITNIGGSFAKSIWGNSKKRRMMDEALRHTPEVAENLKWMMKVLQATGRAAKGESITAFAQAGQKELAQEARGLIPGAIDAVQFWQSPSQISRYIADVRTGKYAKKMSDLMVSPEGKAHMRELRQLDPRSRNAIIVTSHLLVAGGVNAAIPAPSDRSTLDATSSGSQGRQ